MARLGQEPDKEALELWQLPDEKVKARFDEFVEFWEQEEAAKRDLQEFKANTNEPSLPPENMFEGLEAFMEFNRERREYWKHREALRRNQEGAAERRKKSESVIGALLPRNHTLIHHHAGNRYVIRNQNGKAIIASVTR